MNSWPIPKIIYKDNDILVIDKPAGLVVHEGAGKEEWTVEKWFSDCHSERPARHASQGEAGGSEESHSSLIHRLDKDTSGLMVIAKSKEAAENLKNQFAQRQVKKEYTTLVLGKVEPSRGVISGKIGRSPKNRQKMAVLYFGQGREARTKYHVICNMRHVTSTEGYILSLLKVFPETGRMHQIRVHLNYFGYPVIGDQKYYTKISRKISKDLGLTRQFLHASRLKFKHPKTGEWVKFKSDLPDKLNKLLKDESKYCEKNQTRLRKQD